MLSGKLFRCLPGAALVLSVMLAGGCSEATPRQQGDSAANTETKASEVAIQTVTHDQLKETLKKFKGKIVVMDLWANWCIPCKEEFPNLVKLHEEYSEKGVICASLCLPDNVKVEKTNENALAFLKEQNALFPNFRWHEKQDWQEAFDISGPPAVRVYDQEGKLARQFDHNNPDVNWTYEDVENLVQKLLKK